MNNNETVLETDARFKKEKQNSLINRRNVSIKEREELGFSPRYPPLAKYEDYVHTCDTEPTELPKSTEKFVNMCTNKLQSVFLKTIGSYRRSSYMAPPETLGEPLSMNEPYVSDRAIRGKLGASLEIPSVSKQQYLKSSILPQLEALNSTTLTEDQKRAQRYLFTSSYQAAYGNPAVFGTTTYRRIYPIISLETISRPVEGSMKENAYFPSTKTWIPENFDPIQYDLKQTRYPYLQENRPHEVCSHYPRINQIPGYSGSFTTSDRRSDSDNPYKVYKPLNLVRQQIPHEYVFDLLLKGSL
ncbi:unnamed protein product [Heterobilharzia americana]|nr:unnamed protein product [Heterobilharzia americana]